MIAGYIERDGFLHRLPAGVKLGGLALMSVLVLPVSDPWLLGGLLAGIILVYASFGRDGWARLRRWGGLLPLLAFIALLQVWAGSWPAALASVLRILVMVLVADLVTLSTRLQDMMDVFTALLSPFARLGLDVKRLALAVALVLRFVPVLFAAWQGRSEAWRARSPRRPGLVLIGTFFAGALRMADQVAEALDARGFSPAGRNPKDPA